MELKVEVRNEKGSSLVKRLRKTGWIPCIVYGADFEAIAVKANTNDVVHLLHSLVSEHPLIKIKLKNKKEDVIIQDIQYHPFRNEILHIDFHKVDMDELITTSVLVEEIGDSIGVSHGGVVDHIMRELEVECLPADIPAVIEVDITNLDVGDTLHVGDLTPPKGVKFLDDPGQAVIAISLPRVVAETEEGEGLLEGEAKPAEPELIRKREVKEEE
jgi:large subunit ribosomal protein L25